MGPEQRDKAYLWDMLDAALAVSEFVQGKAFTEYLSNRMLRGAIERHPDKSRHRRDSGVWPFTIFCWVPFLFL